MRRFVGARTLGLAVLMALALGGVLFLVVTRGGGDRSAIGVGVGPRGAAAADGAAWIANADSNTLSRIDEHAQKVTATIKVGKAPLGVTVGDGAVWVANARSNTVSRFEARTRTAGRTIALGRYGRRPVAVASGEGAIWVGSAKDDTVSRIDPLTSTVAAAIAVGSDRKSTRRTPVTSGSRMPSSA